MRGPYDFLACRTGPRGRNYMYYTTFRYIYYGQDPSNPGQPLVAYKKPYRADTRPKSARLILINCGKFLALPNIAYVKDPFFRNILPPERFLKKPWWLRVGELAHRTGVQRACTYL